MFADRMISHLLLHFGGSLWLASMHFSENQYVFAVLNFVFCLVLWSIHLPRHLPRILTHSGNRLSLQCGPCVPFLSVSLTHSRGLVKRDENESSHCWKRAHQGNLWKIKRIKPELFVFFLSTSIRFTSKPTNLMLSSNKKMVGLFTSISVFWAKFRIRNGVY